MFGQKQSLVSNSVQQMAAQEQQERLLRIQAAWRAYYGKLPDPLKVKMGQPNDNVKLSYARLIVDKGVSFLFGQKLGIEADDGATESEGDAFLDEIWLANRKMTTLHRLAINGGVAGHCFARLAPPQPPRQPLPRLIVLDPATVTPTWDTDDFEHVTRFEIAWNAMDPNTGQPVAMRQLIELTNEEAAEQSGAERWRIRDQYSPADNKLWITTNDEIWPWDFCPIFHCQNLPAPNEFWGISDLEDDVLEAQRAFNFIMSNINRILRFHAHPKTWSKGTVTNSVDVSVDAILQLPMGGELHNLEMLSDLSSSITFTERIKRALHEISRVPEVATGAIENLGQISGIALQILYQPLIEKTNTKRVLYGDMITAICNAALQMAGKPVKRTILNWTEPLPADKLGEAQTAVLYDQLGVSRDTILQSLGFDPDNEADKKAEEQTDLGANVLKQFDAGGSGATTYTDAGSGQASDRVNSLVGNNASL